MVNSRKVHEYLLVLLVCGGGSLFGPAMAGPLHDAVRAGKEPAVVESKPGIVRILLERGADIDAPSELEARTALHLAADAGESELVSLLLEEGANVDSRDRSGKQAIHIATISGNADIVARLLEAGASVDSREPAEGMTPLLIASLQGKVDLVKLLVDRGADMEARSFSGRTPFFFSTSMESYVNVGDDSLMRYFAEKGVDRNPKDNAGHTPLQWANSRNVPAYQEIAEILKRLGVER